VPPEAAEPLPPALAREGAVQRALLFNPELAAFRRQRCVAAAAVVIADTCPFNPTIENKVRAVNGPADAGIFNRVNFEVRVFLELELRGQRRIRRQGARAGLERTDHEIAFQEISLAVHAARAFDAVLYRRDRFALAEEGLRLNRRALDDVRRLIDAGRLRGVDLVVARSDVADALGQISPARTALATARSDLLRALGVAGRPAFEAIGVLAAPPPAPDLATLERQALDRRADLAARRRRRGRLPPAPGGRQPLRQPHHRPGLRVRPVAHQLHRRPVQRAAAGAQHPPRRHPPAPRGAGPRRRRGAPVRGAGRPGGPPCVVTRSRLCAAGCWSACRWPAPPAPRPSRPPRRAAPPR
jgi:hypothetical protein